MNPRNGPQLDLKLNLSPPRMISDHVVESPSPSSSTVSSTSPQSSCVSSEPNQPDHYSIRQSTNPEETSMVLVGCPRCLMYVMLAEDDPRCPKCKSTVLLDVLHDNYTRKTKKS
ncbi:protein GL2-INTERACTING REPRESSOR 1-like [Primulina huaijiensis]|uniref:protein GL2-INTERACTING REPRESSOR 1-like n=1 Tax=Primulina huaijiensis TaxID=1492673 RepID=UPI003CC7350A